MLNRITNRDVRRGVTMILGGLAGVLVVVIAFVITAIARPEPSGLISTMILFAGTIFTAAMFAIIFGIGIALTGWLTKGKPSGPPPDDVVRKRRKQPRPQDRAPRH